MIKMQNMRPDEEVLLVIKRHWIVYIMLGIYFFSILIFSIILYSLFGFMLLNNIANIIIWLFFSIFIYVEWLNHELDMFVVTNNRIIGIEQVSFLNRKVSEGNLGQVQEVNSQTKGLFANIFNYGAVLIQTAGNKTTMKMDYSPEPMQGARKILNIVDNYRDNHGKVKKIEE